MLAETAFILIIWKKGKKLALAFFPLLLYRALLKAFFKNKIAVFQTVVEVQFYVIKITGLLPHWEISVLPVSQMSLPSFFFFFLYVVIYRAVKHRIQISLSLAMHTLASLPTTKSSESDSSLGFLVIHLQSRYKLERELIVVSPSYSFSSLADWQLVLL